MADNLDLTPGSGVTVAANEIGGVKYQRAKIALGAAGSATDAEGGAGAVNAGTTRVVHATDDPVAAVSGAISGAAVVTDANGTLQQYLRGLVTRWANALGAGTAAAALRVTNASDDPAVTALQVMDDWDESDRAKVNLIAGQAGVEGAGGAATSKTVRVIAATDSPEIAIIGGLTETAPASDTSSSGLNGRLQRIAQRLTSLISLVPASLGGKTAAASLAVTVATDDPLVNRVGEIQETPTTYTVLDRLKALLTGISLAAGVNLIGKVGIDQTTPGTTNNINIGSATAGAVLTVGGNTEVLSVTPTVNSSPDYTIDDVLGGKQTIANAARVAAGSGIVSYISVMSKVGITGDLRIIFFKSDPSASTFTENAVLSINASDFDKILGHVDLVESENKADLGTLDIFTKTNVHVPFKLASGTSLFAVCQYKGDLLNLATTTDLTFNYGIMRD